jgi:hypothetical protein
MPISSETAAEWGYVSGRCAALERDLLDGAFFRDLADARDAAAAHSLLSKTRYAEVFPRPASLESYDLALSGHLRKRLRSLESDGPPGGPVEIVSREEELRGVHELLTRQGIARASAEEAEGWGERLGGGFPWLAGFSVPPGRRALFASQPVRALSLWVDAAFLREMRRLAAASPGLAPFLDARVSLSVLEVCWRAFRGGLGARWLDAFFFCDAVPAPPAAALSAAAKSPAALARLLGPAAFSPSMDDFEETFGRQADDFLTRIARRGAYEVSGVGRVLYYVRRLRIEDSNLRLCIAAVITPLERRQVKMRLRDV